jgi:hypothetical protein
MGFNRHINIRSFNKSRKVKSSNKHRRVKSSNNEQCQTLQKIKYVNDLTNDLHINNNIDIATPMNELRNIITTLTTKIKYSDTEIKPIRAIILEYDKIYIMKDLKLNKLNTAIDEYNNICRDSKTLINKCNKWIDFHYLSNYLNKDNVWSEVFLDDSNR